MIIDAILDRMDGVQYNERETMKYIKDEAKIFKLDYLTKAIKTKKNIEIKAALIKYVRENCKGNNNKIIKYLEKTDWIKELILDGEMTMWRWNNSQGKFERLQMLDFIKIYCKNDRKIGVSNWNKIRTKLSDIKYPEDGHIGCGKYTNFIFGTILDKENVEHDIIYRYDNIKLSDGSIDTLLCGTWLNEKIVEKIGRKR